MGVLSGSVRREVAPFVSNSKPLDAIRRTVKTNRSPFIDRRPKAPRQDVDLLEPVFKYGNHFICKEGLVFG